MSIIFMDGPDHYGATTALLTSRTYAEINTSFGATALVANAGPGGQGHAIQMNSGGYLRKVLPGIRTHLGMGARFYFFDLPNFNGGARIQVWRNIANGVLATLRVLSTGALELRVGYEPDGALLWQSEPVIVAQSWQHVETFLSFDEANPGFRVGVDSVTIFDSDTIFIDTLTPVAQVTWENDGGSYKYRDIYIWDTSGALNNSGMQGDRQVITSFVSSDGPDQDWLPSAGGSGWPLLSNNPPVDTSFVYANEPDDLSNFGFSDIDTDITSISALMVVARMWKSDAGIGTMQLEIVSGGDTAAGAEQSLSTQPGFYSSIFETDPDTGVKWTPSGVNAALAQIRRVE